MSNSANLIGFLFVLLFYVFIIVFFSVVLFFFCILISLFCLNCRFPDTLLQPSKLNFEFRCCSMCVVLFFFVLGDFLLVRLPYTIVVRPTRTQEPHEKRYQYMMISKTISCARRKMRSH